MRSWSPLLIHSRHVRSVVPNPWDPAAPTWCLVGMFDLMFLPREVILPTLIPRGHVQSDIPCLWDPAAPSLYPVGMVDLVFPAREILQSHPDTSQACSIWCAEPLRSCSPELIPRRHVRSSVPRPWDPSGHVRSGVPNPWDPAAPILQLRMHVRS